VSEAVRLRRERGGGVGLDDHLEALRAVDLKEVYAFWSGGEAPDLPRREIVRQLGEIMRDEGVVYRRVRTLTRKVVDVLLRLLRRPDYASDLPGLFRRLPGEEAEAPLEYHEAETGLKALVRRGFLAERPGRSLALQGRVLHAVPVELGDLLADVFREETRTVRGIFSLRGHLASLPAKDRALARAAFPHLGALPGGDDDVAAVLAPGGAEALLARVEPPALAALARRALRERGGVLLRSEAPGGRSAGALAWDRRSIAAGLEAAGVGTAARLALGEYGLACDDEALVLFAEVVEDALATGAEAEPDADEVLRPGGDFVADLQGFLAQVRREPVRVTRQGEVHQAARRRLESGFVSRPSPLATAEEVFDEIHRSADALGLLTVDEQGFLACREAADRWLAQSLEEKVRGLYRTALERPGPRGRSLHQHEMREVVEACLRERPRRWWRGDALAVVARLRYLAGLDERRIRERHRDRHFSAFQSGRETLADLVAGVSEGWVRTLHLLGILDVAVKDGRVVASRLSAVGARILGAVDEGAATGLRPLLVSPDFEVVVLPEGDVTDVVHRLDAFAQRLRSGDVVHFRLTKESVEAAVADGRSIDDLLGFLEARSRSPVPQNVAYSLRHWAAGVSFATLERGVVLSVGEAEVLERVLAVPGVAALLVRRLSPTDALLREEPTDRKTLADLRAAGVRVRD
jgi:hypothetical protein